MCNHYLNGFCSLYNACPRCPYTDDEQLDCEDYVEEEIVCENCVNGVCRKLDMFCTYPDSEKQDCDYFKEK